MFPPISQAVERGKASQKSVTDIPAAMEGAGYNKKLLRAHQVRTGLDLKESSFAHYSLNRTPGKKRFTVGPAVEKQALVQSNGRVAAPIKGVGPNQTGTAYDIAGFRYPGTAGIPPAGYSITHHGCLMGAVGFSTGLYAPSQRQHQQIPTQARIWPNPACSMIRVQS
jgi:hypothetical protein